MTPEVVALTMTISRAEALRLLPGAADPPFAPEGDHFRSGTVVLRLTELPGLALGVLTLPRQRLDLEFQGQDPAFREAFLARLRRQFQRGGG